VLVVIGFDGAWTVFVAGLITGLLCSAVACGAVWLVDRWSGRRSRKRRRLVRAARADDPETLLLEPIRDDRG